MVHTGLVSVTFRQLKAKEVIDLVKKAGLNGIEWGGDIHVPHGNIKNAREVFKMTSDAGLSVASYGSYYKVGCGVSGTVNFECILETAVELHAPVIRIWAGDKASGEADQAWWNNVIDDSICVASIAEKAGVRISYEYHRNTLTDTPESAVKLLKSVNHLNISTYWQPAIQLSVKERLGSLKEVAPWLANVHAFNWVLNEMTPLLDGIDEWKEYIEIIKSLSGDRFCMIEFVKDDSPLQFIKDAEIMKQLIMD